MPPLDTVQSLIDAAKRLRSIAEELGNVEIKARILDDIITLQELRGQLSSGNSVASPLPAAPPPLNPLQPPEARLKLPDTGDPKYARLDAADDVGTYSLAADEPEAEVVVVPDPERTSAPTANGAETPQEINTGADTKQIPAKPEEMTEEQRVAVAEQRIAELEPLHLAALKKMNDLLTPEQTQVKIAATKKGRAAKLSGKALQDAVMAALHLTPEQQQRMDDAKRELHQIRLAIAKQVEGLLSKDQLETILRSHRH